MEAPSCAGINCSESAPDSNVTCAHTNNSAIHARDVCCHRERVGVARKEAMETLGHLSKNALPFIEPRHSMQ